MFKIWFNLQYIRERRRKEEKKTEREVGEKERVRECTRRFPLSPLPSTHTQAHRDP